MGTFLAVSGSIATASEAGTSLIGTVALDHTGLLHLQVMGYEIGAVHRPLGARDGYYGVVWDFGNEEYSAGTMRRWDGKRKLYLSYGFRMPHDMKVKLFVSEWFTGARLMWEFDL